ncbi:YD repeat protein [Pseudomonas chlororaphis]|uniref:YD repeat protein n=1 Tax=Pseudomonas chlororaphis TaxID=587753 RepID=A0A3G7TPL4_9PSED|nr:RHS repeat-associated core domain-containing protein [Pseudomonas chlororaphis]AZE49077.1 YD repeat protein [Pseudomonas chlororaphis]
MKKVKSNASKNQLQALDNPGAVRVNEPFLPTQPQELRESVPRASIIGFNGQLFDSISGTYLLGNGYRAYSPTMRAFYSPDSLSPFGAGGVSRYQYCNLNPVNYTDPSGHSVVGTAIGIIAALSAVTGAVSVGLEIGKQVHSQSDPEYSAYLRELAIGFGTASAVLGVVAGVAGIARFAAARAAARAKAGRTLQEMVARGRLRTILERNVPTDAADNFQYLPYRSGRIESITLNNSTQYMATEELTGCAITVSRSWGATKVSHVAANVMDNRFWRLMHPAQNILREEMYGSIGRFAGARSGDTWAFGFQSLTRPSAYLPRCGPELQ